MRMFFKCLACCFIQYGALFGQTYTVSVALDKTDEKGHHHLMREFKLNGEKFYYSAVETNASVSLIKRMEVFFDDETTFLHVLITENASSSSISPECGITVDLVDYDHDGTPDEFTFFSDSFGYYMLKRNEKGELLLWSKDEADWIEATTIDAQKNHSNQSGDDNSE